MPAVPPLYTYELSYGCDGLKGDQGTFYSDELSANVVPFSDARYGGLPDISGENLLESLWVFDDPGAGALLMPITQWEGEQLFGDIPGLIDPGFGPGGLGGSRTSANFILGFSPAPPASGIVMAVLNPPEEYKQMVRGSLDLKLDSGSALGFSGTVNKSIVGNSLAWNMMALQNPGQPSIDTLMAPGSIFGAFQAITGGGPGLGFLKSNGADGTFPELIDTTGVAGILETQEVINSGEFWIPVQIVLGSALQYKIEWPYSSMR